MKKLRQFLFGSLTIVLMQVCLTQSALAYIPVDGGMCMSMSGAGCHLPDSDGDGTADMYDSCPTDPTATSGECRS